MKHFQLQKKKNQLKCTILFLTSLKAVAKLPLTLMGPIHRWKITRRMRVSKFSYQLQGRFKHRTHFPLFSSRQNFACCPPTESRPSNLDFQHLPWTANSQAGDLFHHSVFIDLQNSLNLQPLHYVLKTYSRSFVIPKFIKTYEVKKS